MWDAAESETSVALLSQLKKPEGARNFNGQIIRQVVNKSPGPPNLFGRKNEGEW